MKNRICTFCLLLVSIQEEVCPNCQTSLLQRNEEEEKRLVNAWLDSFFQPGLGFMAFGAALVWLISLFVPWQWFETVLHLLIGFFLITSISLIWMRLRYGHSPKMRFGILRDLAKEGKKNFHEVPPIMAIIWASRDRKGHRFKANGDRFQEQRKFKEAISCYKDAYHYWEGLHLQVLGYAPAMIGLGMDMGILASEMGNPSKAAFYFERALRLGNQLCDQEKKEHLDLLTKIRANLGLVLLDIGQVRRAGQLFENAAATFKKLEDASPGKYIGDLVRAQTFLAQFQDQFGSMGTNALKEGESSKLVEKMEGLDSNSHYEERIGFYIAQAIHHRREGNFELTIESYLKAKGLLEGHTEFSDHRDLLHIEQGLGDAYENLNKLDQANEYYRNALSGYRTLNEKMDGALTLEFIKCLLDFSTCLGKAGDHNQEGLLLQEAKTLAQFLDQTNLKSLWLLASVQSRCASHLAKLGMEGEAYTTLAPILKPLERAEAREPGSVTSVLAFVYMGLGMYLKKGNSGQARQFFKNSIKLFESSGAAKPINSMVELGDAYSSYGAFLFTLGELPEARKYLEEAEKKYMRCPDSPSIRLKIANLHLNLGSVLGDLRQYRESTELFKQTLLEYEELDPNIPSVFDDSIAMIYANLGSNYWDLKMYKESVEMREKALKIYWDLNQKQKGWYQIKIVRLESYLLESMICAKNLESDKEIQLLTVKQKLRTLKFFEQLEQLEPGYHRQEMAIWQRAVADSYRKLGDWDNARAYLEKSIAGYQLLATNNPQLKISEWSSCQDSLGLIAYNQESYETAYSHWSQSIDLLEQARSLLTSDTGRAMLQQGNHSLYRMMTKVCLRLNKPLEAWHYTERGKARGLADLLGGAKPKIKNPEARKYFDRWLEAEQKLMNVVGPEPSAHHSERLLYKTGQDFLGEKKDGDSEIYQKAIENERASYHALKNFLSDAWINQPIPEPVELAQHLAQMSENKRVLSLQIVPLARDEKDTSPESFLALFILPLWVDLSNSNAVSRALKVHIFEAKNYLEAYGVAQYASLDHMMNGHLGDAEAAFLDFAENLGRHLVLPVLDAIEKVMGSSLEALELDALLISPSREFNMLPLHMAKIDQDRYFIDLVPIVYLGSAHLARRFEKIGTASADKAVLMGPPPERENSQNLPLAIKETDELAELFTKNQFEVEHFPLKAMSIENLASQSQKMKVIHLATHSEFNSRHPLKSHILFHEEWLTLDRIIHDASIDFSGAKLVYLSSCESGWVDGAWHDELMGLTYGMMYAGAESVLASMWRVRDDFAAAVSHSFYQLVLTGRLNFAVALQRAIQSVRKDPVFENPMYWGGLVLTGNGFADLYS